MTRTMLALFASATLFAAGCVPHKVVIPDPTIPHRLAADAKVEIWVRQPDGRMSKQKADAPAGWWIAGPPVVEEPLP